MFICLFLRRKVYKATPTCLGVLSQEAPKSLCEKDAQIQRIDKKSGRQQDPPLMWDAARVGQEGAVPVLGLQVSDHVSTRHIFMWKGEKAAAAMEGGSLACEDANKVWVQKRERGRRGRAEVANVPPRPVGLKRVPTPPDEHARAF